MQKKVRTSPRTGRVTTSFVGRFTPPGGTEITKSFKKLGNSREPGTAAHWLAQQRADVHNNQWVNPRDREWTVGEWSDAWLASYTGVTIDTLNAYRAVIELDIKPSGLGDELLHTIDRVRMGKWIRQLTEDRWWAEEQKPHSRATAQGRRTVLAMILGDAHDEGLILRNPMRKVRIAAESVTADAVMPEELPTRDQLWNLYDIATDLAPLFAPQILVAAGTGVRPGEMLGLTPSRIRDGELHVMQQRRLKATEVTYVRPKSRAGERRVPIGPTVADTLRDHLARYPAAADEPIFRSIGKDGKFKPWHRSTWSDHWDRVRKAAGLDEMRFYLFRHYYASVLIDGGASVKVVMERMGHKDSKYTLERYTHLWPNTEEVTRSLSEAGLYRDESGTSLAPRQHITITRRAPLPPGQRRK